MEQGVVDFVRTVFNEYGLAVLVLFLSNYVTIRMWLKDKAALTELYESEKVDRQSAWKAHNELTHSNNEVLKKVGDALIVIQERVK